MDKLYDVKSNWEFVAWYLIDSCITENDLNFTRAQIMRKNYEEIYVLLKLLGHKKYPQHPEETIQKILQNMRDKYLIIFLGQGDYRLTNEGYSELLIHRKNINKIGGLSPEELTTLRELARKIGDRIRQEHNRVRSGNTHPGLPGKEAALLDIREEETLRIARKANKLVIGAMILSVITAIGVVVFQWLFAPRP